MHVFTKVDDFVWLNWCQFVNPYKQTNDFWITTDKANNTQKHVTKPMQSSARFIKVAHTRLPSVGFQNWSRFLAVSLQVTWVIIPAVGSHYFPPGLQLPPQSLKKAATNFTAWWTQAQWMSTVCLRLLPDSVMTAVWTRAVLHLSPAR